MGLISGKQPIAWDISATLQVVIGKANNILIMNFMESWVVEMMIFCFNSHTFSHIRKMYGLRPYVLYGRKLHPDIYSTMK